MECWITCYEMMLKANGIHLTQDQIEKRLSARGFGDAGKCRAIGVSDDEFLQMANALGAGQTSASSINTLSSLKMMLQMCGPLWVACQLKGSDQEMYNHIIMVSGVDEDARTVFMVNSWVNNDHDSPASGWIPWVEFKQSIKTTLHVQGSVQYLTPIQAIAIAVAP
jgi:hypothetical protein